MRAKLTADITHDKVYEFWNTFRNYNLEKIKSIENMQKEVMTVRKEADE